MPSREPPSLHVSIVFREGLAGFEKHLGVTELSVAIPAVPTIKDRVPSFDGDICRRLADRSLAAADGAEVRQILSKF